jgi:branched-subunit amino acid transport protein
MSLELVPLAVLMFAVTYPSRAVGLLAPGVQRLPEPVLEYLRLVGPAVLAALAAVNTMVALDDTGQPALHIGIEWLRSRLRPSVVAGNLLLGLVVAVGLTAGARALGL